MIDKLLRKAKEGNPVYISHVSKTFNELAADKRQDMNCVLRTMEDDGDRLFKISLPVFEDFDGEEADFIKNYLWAKVYNILSSLGGRGMDIYIDKKNTGLLDLAKGLNNAFSVDKRRLERHGYGRTVNVIDRMLGTLYPGEPGFKFDVHDISQMPKINPNADKHIRDSSIFVRAAEKLEGRILCGIDIGGTDIKAVLVKDGNIACYKEYDWFSADFKESSQLVEPICLIVRLMRAKITLDNCKNPYVDREVLEDDMRRALHKDASDTFILSVVEKVETALKDELAGIDALGLCFPDVVVKNKVVGGEVYKTRGIRNNPEIDYEADFLKLTNLDNRLKELVRKGGAVRIINDGPMAAFTAAVENAATGAIESVNNGVFAHTLGTELGTGWVYGDGLIPDIPLEVYNFIIDLGSFVEKGYPSDDLRSINNFNTELSGTLQKYCSQSGIFRLAMKYFPKFRPDLYKELFDKGYVIKREMGGKTGYFVPTEPIDQRKPFLEHMMSLPERERDEVNDRIWRELGEFLAITWIETQEILRPETAVRVLFGRLVKNRRCFELIQEGAKTIVEDIILETADAEMANTPLMKQLEEDADFTVAQFAQAVGAVYFGNLGLID